MAKCSECDGTAFRTVIDSILKRRYPFVEKSSLKMCEQCGAKYVVCTNCGELLTRVHLNLDVWGVTDTCESCSTKNEEITEWIARGGG